jgi:hypothetical protein
MKYEAHAVEGAATPRFRENPDINEVADEIAAIYAMATRLGGRVVGGHTLTCDYGVSGVPTRIEYLFLVSELPDDSPE